MFNLLADFILMKSKNTLTSVFTSIHEIAYNRVSGIL